MEGRVLHPEISTQGVRLFDVTEVHVVRTERAQAPATRADDSGEVAARVFELFKAGAELRKVVIATRVHPRVVRDLYAEWLVSLVEGENHRRMSLANAEDRRERARMERDQRRWERSLRAKRDE